MLVVICIVLCFHSGEHSDSFVVLFSLVYLGVLRGVAVSLTPKAGGGFRGPGASQAHNPGFYPLQLPRTAVVREGLAQACLCIHSS